MSTTLNESAIGRVESMSRQYERWIVAGCAVVSVLLVTVGMVRYGITLNTDSVGYKATADNLIAGRGLGWWIDPTYVAWPPLFPFLLAAGEWLTPFEAQTVGLIMNAACLVAIVIETHLLLRLTVRRAWLRLLGVAIVAVAPAVLEVNRMLWTEPVFIVLLLGFLLALERALSRNDDWRWLTVAVVFVWLAFLARYIGVVLAPAAALTLVLVPGHIRFVRRLITAAVVGAAALLVPGLWILRNQAVSGTTLDNRSATGTGAVDALLGAIGDVLRAVGQWVFWWAGRLELPIGLLTAGLLIAVLVVLWFRRHDPPAGGADRLRLRRLVPPLIVVVAYLAMLLGSRSVVGFGMAFARFVAPVFIPLLVIGVGGLEAVADRSSPRVRRPLLTIVGIGLTGWLLVLTLTSSRFTVQHYANGAIYASKKYEQADLSAIARDAKLDRCATYSDVPAAVFLWTGIQPKVSPRKAAQFTAAAVDDVAALERAARRGPVCLVWIDFDPHEGILTPQELRKRVDLEPVVERHGVTVYAVHARGD